MSCSANCTLNGQPIPFTYGYTEEDFYIAQLRDYEQEIRARYAEEGSKACDTCIWSDLYKDVHGCRPHYCPCGR